MADPWQQRVTIGYAEGVAFFGFEKSVTVYGVREPGGPVIYVGSTTQDVRHRARAHVKDAFDGSPLPFHCWVRERAYQFEMVFLEAGPASKRADMEKKWVAALDGLLNVTDGGPGMSGFRFAGTGHAKKIAAKLKRGANCKCLKCGAGFWRKPRDMDLGHNKFCSRMCYQDDQRGKPKVRR